MSLNPYFKQLSYAPEQKLLEGLGVEVIKQTGLEVAYLKRSHINIDPLFMEDPLSKFEHVQYIEMYMKTFNGYGQLSDMMSKWGPLMNDQLTLTVMRSRFAEEFPDLVRPMEGDLIYIAMTNTLFEIKYVEHEDQFYQHGGLFYFDIKLERFNYSHETLNTGVDEIDRIEDRFSMAVSQRDTLETESGFTITLENGEELSTEQMFPVNGADINLEDGSVLETEDGDVVTTNAADPFNPNVQNKYIQEESLEVIDFSENNPFGKF